MRSRDVCGDFAVDRRAGDHCRELWSARDRYQALHTCHTRWAPDGTCCALGSQLADDLLPEVLLTAGDVGAGIHHHAPRSHDCGDAHPTRHRTCEAYGSSYLGRLEHHPVAPLRRIGDLHRTPVQQTSRRDVGTSPCRQVRAAWILKRDQPPRLRVFLYQKTPLHRGRGAQPRQADLIQRAILPLMHVKRSTACSIRYSFKEMTSVFSHRTSGYKPEVR